MLPAWALFLISALYLALLFGIAAWGDGRAGRRRSPVIYALAISVYCTSWTFYGAVGRAATSGLDFLPIYLGPALVFTLGDGVLRRMVALSKRHNLTSVADFIGARYGRSQALAALVVLVAVVGVVPYLALQLRAVAFAFDLLARPSDSGDPLPDSALIVALLLALFAVLFGTRQVLSSESHRGMVLAVAFESAVKLAAFLAVGLYAVWALHGGVGGTLAAVARLPLIPAGDAGWWGGFLMQTLLAGAAVLCLPRQFHVTVVEHADAADLPTARGVFPAYLALISLFVLPIAAAGVHLLPGVSGDIYVLALPQHAGHSGLALAVYLGGFSAATSMVIVASIALATMVCNEWVLPVAVRAGLRSGAGEDLTAFIKTVRRAAIFAVVGLAYLFHRSMSGPSSLASLGLVSFAAIAQFAPPLLLGLAWSQATRLGALCGLSAGALAWAVGVLLPALLGHGEAESVTRAAAISLALNVGVFVAVSRWRPAGLSERLASARFLHAPWDDDTGPAWTGNATVADLQALLERFLGADRAQAALATAGVRLLPGERAPASFLREVERLLASALGSGTARLVLSSSLTGRDMQPEEVIRLLDASSHHAIEFSRERLRAALENLPQGVSVVDADLRLVAWNHRYLELFGYPPELVQVGRPIEDLIRDNAARGLLMGDDVEALIHRRLGHMRAGNTYTHERRLPDGTVIEIRGNPMPDGGFVTSYSDVTAYQQATQAQREARELLERRVIERTAELVTAKAATERADAAKTRFLAAASHDLVQPIHAGKLFLAALDKASLPAASGELLAQAEQSLAAAESLLATLLDISRLDANAQEVRSRHFGLREVLDPLAAEFALVAQRRGLRLRYRPTRVVAETDPQLLRRVVQNFLSNAVRYTRQGSVLLGVRPVLGGWRIEVHDTGPGIEAARQQEIFEEFRRGAAESTERGLGLGLAIAQRIARLLEAPLHLRSWPGRGSVFSVTVPRGDMRHCLPLPAPIGEPAAGALQGLRVLCIDNEPAVLEGLRALLQRWGCEVATATDAAGARQKWNADRPPQILLIDYHLEHGEDGIQALEPLQPAVRVPGIVLTADHTDTARAAAAAHGYRLLPKPVKPAALRALMLRLAGAEDGGLI